MDHDPSEPLHDAQHERFAQLLAAGSSQTQAYAGAGYEEHAGNASRLSRNENVKARILWLKKQAQSDTVLTIAEKRRICHEIATQGENRDRLNAIKVDNDLAFDGSEANKTPTIVVKIGGFDDDDD
jgi:phage terminase small subunit